MQCLQNTRSMPECEGVFKVEDSKEGNGKVISLNTSKLAEVGTSKMMELVNSQWPHDVSAQRGGVEWMVGWVCMKRMCC